MLRGAQRRQSWAVEGQAVGAGGKSRSASTPSWEASCVQSLLIKMLIFRQSFPLCSQKYFGLLLPLSCSLPLSTVCGSRLALSATTALLRWKGSTSYVQNQPSRSAVVNNCVGSLRLPSLFLSPHTFGNRRSNSFLSAWLAELPVACGRRCSPSTPRGAPQPESLTGQGVLLGFS